MRPAPVAPAGKGDAAVPVARWLALVALGTGIFSLVTSELLPVGLLTPIALDQGVAVGRAGLMVTVPGMVAALAAPLVALAAGNWDRRRVLSLLMLLLALANFTSAWSGDFAVLLAARVVVGVCIGGYWAIAGGLAMRLVPAAQAGRALAVVFAGVAIASVIGVPVGTVLGELGGWRFAFAVLGAVSLAVCAALVALLPRLPPSAPLDLRTLRATGTEPAVVAGIVATACVVSGHFTAYTYVRPVLSELAAVDGTLLGTLLLVYGAAGVAGNFLAGPAAARATRGTLTVIFCVLAAVLVLLPLVVRGPLTSGLLLAAWGLAYGGVSVGLQTWMNHAAPAAVEAATALYSAMFNLAIAAGALAGGWLIDHSSGAMVMWVGAVLVAAGVLSIGRAPPSVTAR